MQSRDIFLGLCQTMQSRKLQTNNMSLKYVAPALPVHGGVSTSHLLSFYCRQIICMEHQLEYKLLYTISKNIEVYEESVPRTKKIIQRGVNFKAGEENRIVYESL